MFNPNHNDSILPAWAQKRPAPTPDDEWEKGQEVFRKRLGVGKPDMLFDFLNKLFS